MSASRMLLLVSAAPALAGCAARPTQAVDVPVLAAPAEKFDVAALTAEQRALSEAFRARAGQFRKPEWDALFKAGALPYATKRVSRSDVVAVLGPPSTQDPCYLGYELGFEGGKGHACALGFVGDRLVGIYFSATL